MSILHSKLALSFHSVLLFSDAVRCIFIYAFHYVLIIFIMCSGLVNYFVAYCEKCSLFILGGAWAVISRTHATLNSLLCDSVPLLLLWCHTGPSTGLVRGVHFSYDLRCRLYFLIYIDVSRYLELSYSLFIWKICVINDAFIIFCYKLFLTLKGLCPRGVLS